MISIAEQGVFLYNKNIILNLERKMNFLKENMSVVIRLFITHIGMAVFGLVIFGATNMMGDTTMLLTSVLSAIFYAVLVYTTMWEYGAKDKPAIDGGRLQNGVLHGFWVSLLAELPFILLAIVYMLGNYVESVGSVGAVCYTILVMVHSCFTGVAMFVRKVLELEMLVGPIYIVSSVFLSLVAAFGYRMGAKEQRILPHKTAQKK